MFVDMQNTIVMVAILVMMIFMYSNCDS